MDFSPFSEKYTSPLAFDWNYLNGNDVILSNDEDECDNPEFRYLAEDVGIQPNPKNNYGFPREIIDVFKANDSGISIEDMADISRLSIDQMQEEESQN